MRNDTAVGVRRSERAASAIEPSSMTLTKLSRKRVSISLQQREFSIYGIREKPLSVHSKPTKMGLFFEPPSPRMNGKTSPPDKR
jgi:hypothetical protein